MRTLPVSLSLFFVAVIACGGNKPAPVTTSGSADTMKPEPVGTGSAVATTPDKPVESKPVEAKPEPKKEEPPPPPAPPEPDAFMKLSHDEKVKIMKSKVLPAMTKDFKAYDAKKFAKFGCKTCHGKGAAEGGDFKMPNPDLPVLDFEAIKAGKQDPKMAEWMGKTVKPEMAKLLGVEPWEEQHPAGFGCGGCHKIKGM